MRRTSSWLAYSIVASAMLCLVWVLIAFVRYPSFQDTPGAPWSINVPGVWALFILFGWSLVQALQVTGVLRLIRSLNTIATGIFLIMFAALTWPALFLLQPLRLFWLMPLAFTCSILGQILTTAWGKTNRQAWLRTIGAATIGAIWLIACIFAWIKMGR